MDQVKGFVTQKLGPLPFWAWGLLLVAGIVIVMTFLKGRSSNAGGPTISLPDALQPGSLGAAPVSGPGTDPFARFPQPAPSPWPFPPPTQGPFSYPGGPPGSFNPPPGSVFGIGPSQPGLPTGDVNQLRWQPASAPTPVSPPNPAPYSPPKPGAPNLQAAGATGVPAGWLGGSQKGPGLS